jgi:hypothetical protein
MKRSVIFFVKCIMAAIAAVFFFALITMLLWNWLVPVLFAGPVISYGQAFGLLVLTKILFFGIGGRRKCFSDPGSSQQHWKHRFYEKISTWSPEEKEAFKKKMRDKWCAPVEKTHTKDSEVSND